jgi:ribosome-dependent ATPase
MATTGFGLLVSSFMKTQVAALFGTAVLTVIPVLQFSGFFTPTSSLSGGARIMGAIFPSTYFMQISLGAFTKALGFDALAPHFWPLAAIVVGYLLLSLVLLKTQER